MNEAIVKMMDGMPRSIQGLLDDGNSPNLVKNKIDIFFTDKAEKYPDISRELNVARMKSFAMLKDEVNKRTNNFSIDI